MLNNIFALLEFLSQAQGQTEAGGDGTLSTLLRERGGFQTPLLHTLLRRRLPELFQNPLLRKRLFPFVHAQPFGNALPVQPLESALVTSPTRPSTVADTLAPNSGAGGNVGRLPTDALLKDKFRLMAISRAFRGF